MANVLNSFEEVQKMCKKKYDSWSFDIMHYYSNAIFQMAWCKFAERKYNEAMKFAEECIEKSKEMNFTPMEFEIRSNSLIAQCLRKLEDLKGSRKPKSFQRGKLENLKGSEKLTMETIGKIL